MENEKKETLKIIAVSIFSILTVIWLIFNTYSRVKENDRKYNQDILDYKNNAEKFCLREYGDYPLKNIPSKCLKFYK